MDLQLSGKTAFVSGSTSGIGADIARSLAREGARVIVHGRNQERADALVAELTGAGGQALSIVGDLATPDGAETVIGQLRGQQLSVDVLVNNVGVFVNRTWETATPDYWAETYASNVLSVVRLVQAILPGMQAKGWGRILQISTSEAIAPFPNMPDYAASKAALLNLTVSLSKHLSNSGITVNSISPGIIATPAVKDWYRQVGQQRGWATDWPAIEQGVLREVLPNTVGRLGTEADVASLVTFLVSPLSGYINGVNYKVDGGSTATVS